MKAMADPVVRNAFVPSPSCSLNHAIKKPFVSRYGCTGRRVTHDEHRNGLDHWKKQADSHCLLQKSIKAGMFILAGTWKAKASLANSIESHGHNPCAHLTMNAPKKIDCIDGIQLIQADGPAVANQCRCNKSNEICIVKMKGLPSLIFNPEFIQSSLVANRCLQTRGKGACQREMSFFNFNYLHVISPRRTSQQIDCIPGSDEVGRVEVEQPPLVHIFGLTKQKLEAISGRSRKPLHMGSRNLDRTSLSYIIPLVGPKQLKVIEPVERGGPPGQAIYKSNHPALG